MRTTWWFAALGLAGAELAAGQARPARTVLRPGPTALAITADPGGAAVTWTAAAGSTSTVVERSPDGVNFSAISPNLASNRWVDSTVPVGAAVQYRAVAVFPDGLSVPSAAASYAAPAPPARKQGANFAGRLPPASPVTLTSLSAWIDSPHAATILVNFTGTGATKMRVFRALGYLAAQEVPVMVWTTSPKATARTFDTNLQPNTTYSFKILSTLPNGAEVWSNEVQMVTPRLRLTATFLSPPARVHLEWDAFGNSAYSIRRRSDPNGPWELVKNSAGVVIETTNTSYDGDAGESGRTYWYLVCAGIPEGSACAEAPAGVKVP